ncbi:MAG: 2-oxoacid:acceptor oxidoreductase subunit alpha, partial [Candidatus Electrothrix sp. ATG2]|nr:2-oxoacid:acceptor oxidoreductase subunit alpha [Candidatus Electrothrix sp. ATG2]
DHPVIVLAVSGVFDSFTLTVKAFNLSEKYRVPVILLSDEVVAHTRESVELPLNSEIEVVDRIAPAMPPDWYRPYQEDARGVPPMATLGDGYRQHVTGLVHDQDGFPTQNPQEVEKFHQRLSMKITKGLPEIQLTRKIHMDDAEFFVLAYGSVARSAMRAVEEARKAGIRAGLIQLITLFPFPRRTLTPYLQQCHSVLVPELNLGQISREVQRVNQGQCVVVKQNRVDGSLITPQEIYNRLVKLSASV